MHIQAENSDLHAPLERIAALVKEHGGTLHPSMQIHESSGEIQVLCTAKTDTLPLLSIPLALFIPVTHLRWTASNGVLSFTDEQHSLTPIQRALLDDMVQIYNQTGKLNSTVRWAPENQLPNDPLLLNWLQQAWSEFELAKADSVQNFLRTRWIQLNNTKFSKQPFKHLMPIIDLINHHPLGPGLTNVGGNYQLSVARMHADSLQWHWCYNRTDSLSLAYSHGYFENETDYLAALNCELSHPEIGPVQIIGNDADFRTNGAPAMLPKADTLCLQGIVLQRATLPALRVHLALAIRARHRALNAPQAERYAREVLDGLLDCNRNRYAALEALCRTEQKHFPLRALFQQVAGHQLALLNDMHG